MSDHITTPVGRIVQGNLYRGTDKDADGKQKVFKSGANAGQPRTDFYFALAIPKGPETHWNQTPWGQIIESVGKAEFPQAWTRSDFSWKVSDGDSTVFNSGNPPRRPCDFEGFPGNWIVRFSRPFAPKIYNADGSQILPDENFVNPGDYVQVHALIAGNKSTQRPGLFLNHLMVAFSGYGEKIVFSPDPTTVGFGQAPLPAGASSVPPAAFNPPSTPISDPASAVAPAPYPQILVATPPVAPAPIPIPTMTPKAMGATYDQYRQAGWTDAQLIENGLMIAS